MSETVTLQTAGLDKLLRMLKQSQPPRARIGILGDKTLRGKGGPSTNAEIGAAHEFGSPARGLPQRSFLRVPLADHLDGYLKKAGALDKETMAEVIRAGTVTPWLKQVAAVAETVVFDAFDTSGFGKWPAWKDKNYSNNANQILVDTQQLRNSITSEVKE